MMIGFEKCKWEESCGYDICIPEFCKEYEAVPITNADHIRSMTDEELACYLSLLTDLLDLLKCIYAWLCVMVIFFALILVPIAFAVAVNPWWALTEIVAAPVGIALLIWGACKIDYW